MTFLEHFNELEDGRTDINITYDLLDVVFLTIVAVVCGAEGWQDIQWFGEGQLQWLRRHRPFTHGIPRRHTIARIINAIDTDDLLQCFMSWLNSVRQQRGQTQIAIDGKTLRRSHDGDSTNALHLLSAMSVDSGLVLYQKTSEGKKNEIISARDVLRLIDISHSCVTLDAMHCQVETVDIIREKQADYVIQVKCNQKHLYNEIQAYFHKTRRDEPARIAVGTHHEVDKGHGRIEQRTCTTLSVSEWLEHGQRWRDLNSVVEVKRQVTQGETEREETSYYITSLSTTSEQIGRVIRRHWQIENGQHWILDVVMREDDSRLRTDSGPANMAMLRRFALNLARLSPAKESMRGKLKRANWSDEFRTEFFFGKLAV